MKYATLERYRPLEIMEGTTIPWRTFQDLDATMVTTTVIPRIWFRTAPFPWNQIPTPIKNILHNATVHHPRMVQVYVDDEDARTFMAKHFPQHVALWDNLIPGAFRSDLLRLCLLVQYGGVYSDIGHEYVTSIHDIVHNGATELILTNEPEGGRPGVHNAFMAAKPHHPCLEQCLAHVAQNITRFSYGDCPLDITGPRALGKCLRNVYGEDLGDDSDMMVGNHPVRVFQLVYDHPSRFASKASLRIEWKGAKLLNTKFEGYHDMMYHHRQVRDYAQMWHDHEVYRFHDIYPFSSFPPAPPTKWMFRMSPYALRDIPQAFRDIFHETHTKHADYIQVYMDDNDCLTFLTKHYPEYVPHWNALVPGAYKSDLVRLCVLHEFGGTYNDMGHQYLTSLEEIVDPTADLIMVNERTEFPGIHNAFLSVRTKHHPIVHALLVHITDNIRIHYYGENELDITGPMALGKCMERLAGYAFTGGRFGEGLHVIQGHRVQLLQHRMEGEYLTCRGQWVIKTKFDRYSELMYHARNTPSYHDLWPRGLVYLE